MIRDEAMREKIKSLWKLCFNDSDEFTDIREFGIRIA